MRALNSNMNIEYGGKEANENIEADISVFTNFLENIREDYQNSGTQLRTTLNKFEERYMAAKSKSISQLVSLLYDLNSHLDSKVNIRGGSMIRVQIESVKQRKTEGSGRKRKQPGIINDKENLDPQTIPSRKKRNAGKKDHNLSKNVAKNRPN